MKTPHTQTKFHVRSGDFVRVITGDHKGVEGKILKVNRKKLRVYVDGVPKIKKAIRPSQQHPEGGFIEIDRPIHISNVKKVDVEKKPIKATKKAKTTKKKAE